jgi:hypothetical protein
VVGIELPGEDRLPPGSARDLVVALHELYRGAGRPGLRKIAKAIVFGNFTDTVSHEAISDMLNGKNVPRWSKLDCVVRQLAEWNAPRLDPSTTAARFLSLWDTATGGTPGSAAQPPPASFGSASSLAHPENSGAVDAFPSRSRPTVGLNSPIPFIGADGVISVKVPRGDSSMSEWSQSRQALLSGQPRWREPANDRQTAQVRALRENQSSHPVFSTRSGRSDSPPTMRIGVRVACSQLLATQPTSSAVRNSFLSFLNRQPLAGLVGEFTLPREVEWEKWGGHGRANHEAVLTRADGNTGPIGWARLLLPEPRIAVAWRDSHSALFLLHIEPQARDSGSAASLELLDWLIPFRKVLEVPPALADFLSKDLGLEIPAKDPEDVAAENPFSDISFGPSNPVASAAIWLTTPREITDLVDISAYHQLPGSAASPQFDGYAVGFAEGSNASEMAIEWIRQMCDYVLHLDDSDSALSSLTRQMDG